MYGGGQTSRSTTTERERERELYSEYKKEKYQDDVYDAGASCSWKRLDRLAASGPKT